jgi:hypothetical protein
VQFLLLTVCRCPSCKPGNFFFGHGHLLVDWWVGKGTTRPGEGGMKERAKLQALQ